MGEADGEMGHVLNELPCEILDDRYVPYFLEGAFTPRTLHSDYSRLDMDLNCSSFSGTSVYSLTTFVGLGSHSKVKQSLGKSPANIPEFVPEFRLKAKLTILGDGQCFLRVYVPHLSSWLRRINTWEVRN